MPTLMTTAFQLAAELHADQKRKGTRIPYLSHVMAVSALVLEDGGGEEAAAGALLHDAAEDQGGWRTIDRIRASCGDAVTEIVIACSDSIEDKGAVKPPWKERKEKAIYALPHHSSDVLRVIAADKLHNATAILADLQDDRIGVGVWSRFNVGREDVLWYYREMATGLRSLLRGSRSVARLEETLGAIAEAVALDDMRVG